MPCSVEGVRSVSSSSVLLWVRIPRLRFTGHRYWLLGFYVPLGLPSDHLQLFSSSFAFRITINYSGPWRAEYYGYHGTEAQSTFYNRWGNYTGGTLGGSGYTEK